MVKKSKCVTQKVYPIKIVTTTAAVRRQEILAEKKKMRNKLFSSTRQTTFFSQNRTFKIEKNWVDPFFIQFKQKLFLMGKIMRAEFFYPSGN